MILDLHYRRTGPSGAPTVVILHGLFGTLDNWGSIGRELAEPSGPGSVALDVILVDLRDHGRSPHSAAITYELMAKDVHHLLTRLDLHDVVLVGHSMGGKVTMVVSQHWPELIRSLVVVDISPKEHENNHSHILEALRTADLSPGKGRREVEEHMATFIKEPGVVQFLMKNLYWVDQGRLAWRMNVDLLARELDGILAAIGPEVVKIPTLFIRGGQSDYILREDLPAIAEQFPDSRVVTIPYAGHWVHAQAPDEVITMIREAASKA